ncbi:LysR family transcriptional regulator [Shewanella sairae]|uniref:LysR family transcriptional regulator n=1 Tax=Shewanella sairae TaxID=190310 RepID=A0ABQ4PQP6_9GAMM|nr:LysR family transcriptional regulator [Shewanella sairae]MCL1132376.1 LysR family transcriptional regulator [Shewanella sairae]GIU51563.1 LysR family transcriptional regulator [Shewanella sairae]
MDYKLFKTFIEVSKYRHFGRAADSLHLTQAAVSSRIKLLEQYYNRTLLNRGGGQVTLTTSGELLYGYATRVMSILEETKKELLHDTHEATELEIAVSPNVLHTDFQHKLVGVTEGLSACCVSVSVLNHDQIRKGLILNTLSIVFSFNRVYHDDFFCKKISSVTLVLVSTSNDSSVERHVFIDWGDHFLMDFSKRHPSMTPIFRTESGYLGLQFILDKGGSAYLPLGMVQSHLQKKNLYKILGVPELSYFMYIGYNKKLLPETVTDKLAHLLNVY